MKSSAVASIQAQTYNYNAVHNTLLQFHTAGVCTDSCCLFDSS